MKIHKLNSEDDVAYIEKLLEIIASGETNDLKWHMETCCDYATMNDVNFNVVRTNFGAKGEDYKLCYLRWCEKSDRGDGFLAVELTLDTNKLEYQTTWEDTTPKMRDALVAIVALYNKQNIERLEREARACKEEIERLKAAFIER